MQLPPSLAETFEAILREQEPNFLRLYLSPHVAQACLCLDRYLGTTWPGRSANVEDCQSFLANGFEEALSGALKLARYNRPAAVPGTSGIVFDPADRLAGFASARLADGAEVEFLPGLIVLGKDRLDGATPLDDAGLNGRGVAPLVLVSGADEVLNRQAETIRRIVADDSPLVITCVDRAALDRIRAGSGGILAEVIPDLVVFDETFAGHAVPFGAFTGRRSVFEGWNHRGKATFHSTTFQPNTISTRHLVRCLAGADPEFFVRYRQELDEARDDLARRAELFRRHYSPALLRLIRATGFETKDVRAAGSFLFVEGRAIFDAVGGVACSNRGHNPPHYVEEVETLASDSPRAELRQRLRDLTGLDELLPAVSGGGAVEIALKVALVAQFPRRHIIALKAGFGGKTLLALTATANPSYKQRLDPLYADVHYVDPFAPDAEAQIDALLNVHAVAVVQVELVQSVGGVRPIPESLIRHLDQGRRRWGYLLLVDEVQTGMYRTGTFTRSRELGLTPDLLLLGKGTSDMMFPFALTLCSAAVREALATRCPELPARIEANYGYDQGYSTVLNVLRLADEVDVSRRVAEAGALCRQLLTDDPALGAVVREVRVFGLLIGIELETRGGPRRWLRKRLGAFYLLGMLGHDRFPVFAGLCQYEPNVLKITPPLNASDEEIQHLCGTIITVLRQPLHWVLGAGLAALLKSTFIRKTTHEHRNHPAPELIAR